MNYLWTFLFMLLVLTACERPYTPDSVFEEPEFVVEGYVEYGDAALPPYVILTRSVPYFSDLTAAELDNIFVHNARVRVSRGEDTTRLFEVCFDDLRQLSPALANIVAEALGLGANSDLALNVCVYTDPLAFVGLSPVVVEPNARYDLHIEAENHTIQATTTIPPRVTLDSVRWINHPDFPENDSLVEVRGFATDPASQENYYRLFTRRNREPVFPNGGGSTLDDKIFNGGSFEFPIVRGQSVTDEIDINSFGYFFRGDTATIRLGSLDYGHFRFFQTLEYNVGSQGPFSNYLRIDSNVDGALGVWGGISLYEARLIIPK